MEQAFEVANNLGASKIVYHNGYIPRGYTPIEWKTNVYQYWNEFLKGKNYKILRIKSAHDIPDSNQLKEKIEELLLTDKKFSEIILSDW